MKTIFVNSKTHGPRSILVSEEDYETCIKHTWSIYKGKYNDVYYACTTINKKKVKMHRFILNAINPKIFVDHIDHNGLNNQRCNIRLASIRENNLNRTSNKNSSSFYLGVSYYTPRYNTKKGKVLLNDKAKWRADIRVDGKTIFIGYFKCEIEAAKAYDKKAIELHKEYANLNFK